MDSFRRHPFTFPTSATLNSRIEALVDEAAELRGQIRINERVRFETWAEKIHQRYSQNDSATKAGHIAEWASKEARGIVDDLRAELVCVEEELAVIRFAVEQGLIT